MFEKIEKVQLVVLGIILALGVIFATAIATKSITKDVVLVTGSANQVVKSDSGSLSIEIVAKKINKQLAYATVKRQLPIVMEYLKNEGLTDVEVRAFNGYYNYRYDSKTGNNTNVIDSYNISLPLTIRSNDVEKIKKVSIDIQNLIDKGVDINVSQPDYFYSKLSELKVELLAKATVDAKQRAAVMLKATHNRVGKIQSLKMGVFQITTVDSTNVSDYGVNDTSSIDKRVTSVANVTFRIK